MATNPDRTARTVLTPEAIRDRIAAELPRWSAGPGGITRLYRTPGWKATLMVVNAIGYLAEAADHHPDLTVSYASVGVLLITHSAAGVTEHDFQLARRIEELLLWQGRGAASLVGDAP